MALFLLTNYAKIFIPTAYHNLWCPYKWAHQESIAYFQRWAVQVLKVCAASARATTKKILRRKLIRKPQKIIAPQAHAQVWRFEKYNSNWLTAQTSLGYDTKPMFKTNYERNQISKQKNYWFPLKNTSIWKCTSLNLLGRRTFLYLTKKYS